MREDNYSSEQSNVSRAPDEKYILGRYYLLEEEEEMCWTQLIQANSRYVNLFSHLIPKNSRKMPRGKYCTSVHHDSKIGRTRSPFRWSSASDGNEPDTSDGPVITSKGRKGSARTKTQTFTRKADDPNDHHPSKRISCMMIVMYLRW